MIDETNFLKVIKKFSYQDLHKKFGRIIYHEPCDSDLQEGNFMAQLWFVTSDMKMYLLGEWDTRKPRSER
jgi:hypothetical protein